MRASLVLLLVCVAVDPLWGQGMKRITSRDTPAHRASRNFMRGVNLGNAFEYGTSDPAGGLTYGSTDLNQIEREGFDHVRIPVAWHLYTGPAPNYTISNSIFNQVDALVNLALSKGLSVIINEHHFHDLSNNPNAHTNKFHAIWRQVAAHYANFPDALAFELLNEPNGNATSAVMNRIYAETIRQIRVTNPGRTLFVGPGDYNGLGELRTNGTGILLPDDDENLIVTVHSYDPYYFTHQGAEWALPDTATLGVVFPGPPETPLNPHPSITHQWVVDWFRDYNLRPASVNPSSPFAFTSRIRTAAAWAEYYGRPVHLGEFGCYEKASAASRVGYHRAMRQVMDENGLGWCLWDWKAGFHYIRNGQPDPPGMREALFPPIDLKVSRARGIEFQAAVGKTYRIQRTRSMTAPVEWETIATQTLATPTFTYNDEILAREGGFFRVEWVK